jgi:hypothetical protein
VFPNQRDFERTKVNYEVKEKKNNLCKIFHELFVRLSLNDKLELMKKKILEVDSWTLNIVYFLIREMIKLDLAMRRVKETSTFNGMGFFFVDRTTLTAMLSTTVTYLIVLVQNPSTSSAGAVVGQQTTNL